MTQAAAGVPSPSGYRTWIQAEVEVQLDFATRLGFLDEADYRRLLAFVTEVGKMLNGLIASMQPTENEKSED